MAATIGWLLEQNTLGPFRLLAGEQGLGNSITSVNIMDNPDTIQWLTQGELILTTGYLFLENTWLRNNAITELSRKGCAGIGFVLKRYMDQLPQEMRDQADSLGFPIISVPYERSLAEVGWLIYERIFADRMSETQRLAQIYKRLTETVAMDHDVSHLLITIVAVVGCPTMILDAQCQVIEYEVPTDSPGGLGPLVLTPGQPLFPRQTVRDIRERVVRQRPVSVTQALEGGDGPRCVIFPMTDANDILGFLCCCETGRELGSLDHHFIRTIQPMLSLYLMRRMIRFQTKANTKSDFIRIIMSPQPISQADLLSLCKLYQLDHHRWRVCAVIQLTGYQGSTLQRRREMVDTACLAASEYLEGCHSPALRFVFDNSLILFYFFPDQPDTAGMLVQGHGMTRRLLELLDGQGIPCRAGIGKAGQGIDTLQPGLHQAFDAIRLGEALHPGERLYSYQEDQLYHILTENLSRRQAQELYEETLGKLRRFDQENRQELALTVQNLLKNHLSAVQTAREMFIHRNTLAYRLEKVREILGADPRELEVSLRLLLSFGIEKLLEAGLFREQEKQVL